VARLIGSFGIDPDQAREIAHRELPEIDVTGH
jgi:hypothetical protein